MRIGFRADSDLFQGTGHVMRCLTLARQLKKSGIDIIFFSYIPSNSWLNDEISRFNIQIYPVEKNSFNCDLYKITKLDLLIVDSYEIDTSAINSYSKDCKLMAIIDGSDRGIKADIYLDQNIYEFQIKLNTSRSGSINLLGPKFALIRDEIRELKWTKVKTPMQIADAKIVCFAGGSDPKATTHAMAEIISGINELSSIFVAPTKDHKILHQILGGSNSKIMEFNQRLPALISTATSCFSAAGSSAWEILTIGVPSVFTVTAENQFESSLGIKFNGLGKLLGNSEMLLENIQAKRETIRQLLLDHKLRLEIFESCVALFDGYGTERVKEQILHLIEN
jgi:spore coat polysaccharide biosynthesis predicted glycosyltransferase SpsG